MALECWWARNTSSCDEIKQTIVQTDVFGDIVTDDIMQC